MQPGTGNQLPQRKAPGILRLLPDTLPFYPYHQIDSSKHRQLHHGRRKRRGHDIENVKPDLAPGDSAGDGSTDEAGFDRVQHAPLEIATNTKGKGFTLFFFVDSTNRQSLLAMPIVSKWFEHALNNNNQNENRLVCIPNQPSPHEINMRNSNSDPIAQAAINSSTTSVSKANVLSTLLNTGFYHLPFLHPKRLPLIHLLGATRVPCVIVVSNSTGRIISRYGWEAIERESSSLEEWTKNTGIGNKKYDGEDRGDGSTPYFESEVKDAWGNGQSGLPMWWHLLGWILWFNHVSG